MCLLLEFYWSFIRASIDDQQTVLGIKNANEMEGMIGCSEHHDATRARVKKRRLSNDVANIISGISGNFLTLFER